MPVSGEPWGYNFGMGVVLAKQTQIERAPGSGTGVVLGIDYGRKRIGLAISDAMGFTARPLETIEAKSAAEELARLEQIARERGVARIVVGLPLRLDGTEGAMAGEARRFARRLERALHLPVEVVDERLTSWAAREWKAAHPELGRGRGEDEIAAAILLEDFLARKRESSG